MAAFHLNPLAEERLMAATNKSGKKPTTKSEIYAFIAEKTNLKRKDVVAVFDTLGGLIERDLKRGPGIFNMVGLMKIKLVHKPAVPARKGINPFTKEEVIFKAKPARNVVKIQPLKALKEMV
jgi:nucleoid DNA-binding protein